MEEVENSFVYKLINFFYKRLVNWAKRLSKAARELNFLMYRMRFGERDDDIYVISYPKSGTTMLQMILYQLTTDGSMDFKHIDDVAPWIRNEAFEKRKPKELESPRVIKSHDAYPDFDASKGHFIFVMRDGRDVAVSKYHQDKNYINPNLEFNKYMESFFEEGKHNWFTFHRKWIENKKKRRILYLTYDEVKNNKEAAVQKIISFCRLQVNESDVQRAIERSEFGFMKQHEEKFGIKAPPAPKVYDQFIRKGKSGNWKEYFSEDQSKTFEAEYEKHLGPLVGRSQSRKTQNSLN